MSVEEPLCSGIFVHNAADASDAVGNGFLVPGVEEVPAPQSAVITIDVFELQSLGGKSTRDASNS